MKRTHVFAITLGLLAAACDRNPPASPPAGTKPVETITPWLLPTPLGAAQPDLSVTNDGRILLSWLSSKAGRRNALQFAEFDARARWNGPRTIAVGKALLANWADTPHIAATPDGAMWVQWLQTRPDAPSGYDTMLARSRDGGMNWSDPVQVHGDNTRTVHGFAALWPQTRDTLGIAWLDGRNTAGDAAPAATIKADRPPAAMTLRAAVFDGNLQAAQQVELDAMTCDCCQTGVAITGKGALLAYRDRTPQEIRDIAVTRFDGTTWSAPRPVNADQWRMPACPVNGPVVAAQGMDVVVAWYTAAGNTPTLKLARSSDAGDSFAAPVVVDRGDAVQGRADVAFDGRQAWVLWVREDAAAQTLWLARYSPDLTRELQRMQVARLQGKGRGTGFPKLALRDGAAYVVWTDVIDAVPQLRGAVVRAR